MSAFVNYRVNFLGGLSHGALRNNVDGNTASGNWGIQDVLAGLTWVQNNIGNFGGDPTKVTIQGESAGATTVMSLVTSPLAYPPNVPAALFRGAIAQSVWPMMDNGVAFSQNVRDVAGNAMAWAMQCTTSYASTSVTAEFSAIAACLRTDSVQMAEGVQGGFFPTSQGGYVTTTQWSAFETANGGAGVMTYINWQTYGYSPCVDGYVWTKAPKDHAIDGVGVAVHLMVGNNANEEALFAPSYVGLNTPSYVLNNGYFYALYGSQLSHQSTAIEWVNAGNAMPTDVLQNLPYYSTIVDPWQRQTNQLDDGYFSANIGIIFDTFSAQTGRAANSLFRYVYGEPNQANAAPFLGAPHTAELTYVWGVYAMGKSGIFDNLVQADTPKTVYTAEEIAMGSTIQKYWANFIHTGTPNVASMNAPTWSGITATEKHTMVFRSTVRYGAKLDPCVMFVSCLAEPTADFRRAAITLWTSSFASKPDMATCSGPVEIGFSRIAPFQFADNCTAAAGIAPASPAVASPPPAPSVLPPTPVDLSTAIGGGGPVTPVTAGGVPVSAVTQYGDITGRHSRADGVNRFYGVRFGATTAGANRFKPPQTPASWSTPQQTITHTGCAQWNGSPAWSGSYAFVGSEDCLFLSIVTPNAGVPGLPRNPVANTYPVQFWIYGGGFAEEAPPFYQWKDDFYAAGSSNLGHLPHSGKVRSRQRASRPLHVAGSAASTAWL